MLDLGSRLGKREPFRQVPVGVDHLATRQLHRQLVLGQLHVIRDGYLMAGLPPAIHLGCLEMRDTIFVIGQDDTSGWVWIGNETPAFETKGKFRSRPSMTNSRRNHPRGSDSLLTTGRLIMPAGASALISTA